MPARPHCFFFHYHEIPGAFPSAPSWAAIFSGQYASTTGCYTTAAYFAGHPQIEALQMSFSIAGYTTLGAGKLFHHPAGAIDQRGWTEFFLRNKRWRYGKWPDGEELYNLQTDPEEKNNLAGRENQKTRLEEFRKALASKQKHAASKQGRKRPSP